MTTAQTAAEAFERYQAFLASDSLVQREWHDTAEDGRQLACALAALGDNINSAADCPANIMPRWLANFTIWFFDDQTLDDAKDWGLRFYTELKRLNGVVPFSVVHDWQANVVGPLNVEIAEKLKLDASLPRAVMELHAQALSGKVAPRTAWFEALRPSLHQAYLFRYKANAYANADAYAYADAYADARAAAYADAYAYAAAYAHADADANAYANANADAEADAKAKAKRIKRLADGMVECLVRVQP